MPIILATITRELEYMGAGDITLPAGKRLVIETSPQGEEILDFEAIGKDYNCYIYICLSEK